MRAVMDSLCGESILHSLIFRPKRASPSVSAGMSYTTEIICKRKNITQCSKWKYLY